MSFLDQYRSSENENILLGVIGAILGAIPGFLIWLLIGKLGYIAVISGFILIAGILFGYKFFAKEINIFGYVFCFILVIFLVYFATKLSYCIAIHDGLKEYYTFKECYSSFSDFLKISGVRVEFMINLIMGYVATAAGAVTIFKKYLS